MKRIMTIALVIVLVFGLTGMVKVNTTSNAATARMKKTLQIGEKLVFNIPDKTNIIKTVKSSNKAVATVKKNSKKKDFLHPNIKDRSNHFPKKSPF